MDSFVFGPTCGLTYNPNAPQLLTYVKNTTHFFIALMPKQAGLVWTFFLTKLFSRSGQHSVKKKVPISLAGLGMRAKLPRYKRVRSDQLAGLFHFLFDQRSPVHQEAGFP